MVAKRAVCGANVSKGYRGGVQVRLLTLFMHALLTTRGSTICLSFLDDDVISRLAMDP